MSGEHMKLALLAGTQSGCGKTTMMLALLQYFKIQQREIAAFKAGPDFLDPLWHQVVSGRPSYNLDTRMIGVALSRQVLAGQSQGAEFGLIEGVMGLFDGREGVGKEGSSVDLARQLGCPVLLVVDAKGMSGSIVPQVSGFCHYAEKIGVRIAGVLANRVGSSHHAGLLKTLLAEYNMPPLIAYLLKEAPGLPERHLGLMRPDEVEVPEFSDSFQVDDALLMAAFQPFDLVALKQDTDTPRLTSKKIAVARDAACCFIYPANIDWLKQQGAQVVYFSPLAGDRLPADCDALWLPGGYPELYGQALSQSASLASLRAFIEADKPVLAECGGAMLLGRMIIDQTGCAWPMAQVLPFDSRMQKKLAALGYRQDETGVRGHEFHHSVREAEQIFTPAFHCDRGDNGIRYKNLRASYVHWYFASQPERVAEWFGA